MQFHNIMEPQGLFIKCPNPRGQIIPVLNVQSIIVQVLIAKVLAAGNQTLIFPIAALVVSTRRATKHPRTW